MTKSMKQQSKVWTSNFQQRQGFLSSPPQPALLLLFNVYLSMEIKLLKPAADHSLTSRGAVRKPCHYSDGFLSGNNLYQTQNPLEN